jgi:transcriptional regulator with XRE-family HTH domain
MLGVVLKAWRDQNGINIRDAAKIIGTSSATLSRIENGKNTDANTLVRVLDWLLHKSKTPNEDILLATGKAG